jgi:hypothetical protein
MNSIITDFSQQFGITPNKIFKAEGDVTAFPQASGVKVQDADTANAEYLKKLETAKDSLGSFDSSSKPLKKVQDFFGERTVWTNDKDVNIYYSKIINATHKNLLSAGKESILFKDSAEEPGKKNETWDAIYTILAAKDNDLHNPSSNLKLLQDKARSIVSSAMALKASDIQEPIKTPERVLVAQILGGTDAQKATATVQLANRLNADDLGNPSVNLDRETGEVKFNSGFFSKLAETLDAEHGGQIAATKVFEAVNAILTKTMTKEDYKNFKLDETQIKDSKERLWSKFENGAVKDIKAELNETLVSANEEDRSLWTKVRNSVNTVIDGLKDIVTAPFRGGEDARNKAMQNIMTASAGDSIHALSLEVAKENLERVKVDLDSNRDLVTLSLGRDTLVTANNPALESKSTEIGSALLANHIMNTLKLAETLKSPDVSKINISDADVKTKLESINSSQDFTVKADDGQGKLQSYQVNLDDGQLRALKNAVKNGTFVSADVRVSDTVANPDIGLKQNGAFVQGKTVPLAAIFNALKDQMKEERALLDDRERTNISNFVQVLKGKNILDESDLNDTNKLQLKDAVTSDALTQKVTTALQNTNLNNLLNDLGIQNLNVVLNSKDAKQKETRDSLGAFIEDKQSHLDDQLAYVKEIDMNASKSLADTANQSNISMPHAAAAEVLISLITAKGEWKTDKLLKMMDGFEPIQQLKQSIQDKYTQLNQQKAVIENSQLLAVLRETQANIAPSGSADGLKIKGQDKIETLLNDVYKSSGSPVDFSSSLKGLRDEVTGLVKNEPSLQADILKSMDDSKFSDDKNSPIAKQRNEVELFLNLGEFVRLADERRTQLVNKGNLSIEENKSLTSLNTFLTKFEDNNKLKLADKEKYTEEMSHLQTGLKSVDDQLDEIKQSVGRNFNVSSRSVKDLLSPKSNALTENDRTSLMKAVSSTIARTAMVLGIGGNFEEMTKKRVNESKLNSNPLMSNIMSMVSDHILQAA